MLIASVNLTVIGRKIIIQGPRNQKVCKGCEMRQQCRVSSSSSKLVKVSWKKDNNAINLNRQNRVSIDPKTNELIIKNVEPKDAGIMPN